MSPPAERDIQPISSGVRHKAFLMTFRCCMTSNRIAKAKGSVNAAFWPQKVLKVV